MGIFDGIMILSDLDGTLAYRGEISREHVEAIEYFVENGGAFCPATGRPEKYLFDTFPDLPLSSYCIVKNGTAIYDCTAKKYIWYKAMEKHSINRVLHLLKQFPDAMAVTVHTLDASYSFKKEDGPIERDLAMITGEILKIVIWIPQAQRIIKYCEQFDDLQCVCSSDHLFEMLPTESGKGVCTDKLRGFLNNVKCFVGIGDYENDITLLQAADIAVAVDGGFEPLKEYADWIAPPFEEHPITWLVNKLKDEIEKGRLL